MIPCGYSYRVPKLIHVFVVVDVVKRSVQGRNAAATQVQTAQYLKPLFKALRQRASLPPASRSHPANLLADRLTSKSTGPRTGRLAITGRSHPLRSGPIIPTGKRCLSAVEYRKCRVAHRSHHGRVSLEAALYSSDDDRTDLEDDPL